MSVHFTECQNCYVILFVTSSEKVLSMQVVFGYLVAVCT